MIILVNKRNFLKILGTLAVTGVFAFVVITGAGYVREKSIDTSADGNWGLSFQDEGQAPAGNASAGYLKKYDAYYIGDTSRKVLYLTFDAGYENGYTAKILDVLKKHNVKAAFFLVGNYIAWRRAISLVTIR